MNRHALAATAALTLAVPLAAPAAAAAFNPPPPPPSGTNITSGITFGDNIFGFTSGPDGFQINAGGWSFLEEGWPTNFSSTTGPGFSYQVTNDYSGEFGSMDYWKTLKIDSLMLSVTSQGEWYYTPGTSTDNTTITLGSTEITCTNGMCTMKPMMMAPMTLPATALQPATPQAMTLSDPAPVTDPPASDPVVRPKVQTTSNTVDRGAVRGAETQSTRNTVDRGAVRGAEQQSTGKPTILDGFGSVVSQRAVNDGDIGAHASSQATPHLGVGNLSRNDQPVFDAASAATGTTVVNTGTRPGDHAAAIGALTGYNPTTRPGTRETSTSQNTTTHPSTPTHSAKHTK